MKPAAVIALLVGFLIPHSISAQTPAGLGLDQTVAPGRNYVALVVPNHPTAWLPTARVAERWQWLVTERT
jgi:hypothetical protein